VCVPSLRELVVRAASPLTSPAVPNTIVPSWKLTAPLGVPSVVGVTLATKLTGEFTGIVGLEELSATNEPAGPTVSVPFAKLRLHFSAASAPLPTMIAYLPGGLASVAVDVRLGVPFTAEACVSPSTNPLIE
jgi:hypothetical protein